jgi:glyoxylase-like metal-dependent hydrolase (beta-lactamase superfamily II)
LATIGYSPSDVETEILSHLHEDHIGGLSELRDADLLVSTSEWQELTKAAPEPQGFLRKHIQIPGLKRHQISFEPADDPALAPFTESLDVMGDGSLVLLPTPGHTAGSMSLLVRRGTRSPLLLVGDLTYGADKTALSFWAPVAGFFADLASWRARAPAPRPVPVPPYRGHSWQVHQPPARRARTVRQGRLRRTR